jgi:hypothetical protein
LLLALPLLLGGCASIEPQPVRDFNQPEGIPYYEGSYYLLVWADGAGNLKWQLDYLADPNKKFEYRTRSFLSKVEAELTFSNGLLTKGNTTIDSTAVPKAVVGAVEKVLMAIANDPDRPLANSHAIPAPSLFKLVSKGNTIVIYGHESAGTVNATVTAKPK